MTSEQVKTPVLLGLRAIFDEKGGFGGGSHRHRYKKYLLTLFTVSFSAFYCQFH